MSVVHTLMVRDRPPVRYTTDWVDWSIGDEGTPAIFFVDLLVALGRSKNAASSGTRHYKIESTAKCTPDGECYSCRVITIGEALDVVRRSGKADDTLKRAFVRKLCALHTECEVKRSRSIN